MSLPKFLRTTAVVKPTVTPRPKPAPKAKTPRATEKLPAKAEQKRKQRELNKDLPKPPAPVGQPPAVALAKMRDAWATAQIAHLAGGPPPESPTSALILAHLERTNDKALSPAARVDEILDAEEGQSDPNSQDALVARHRVDIAETRRIVMGLIDELDFATEHEDLFDLIAMACAPEPAEDGKKVPDKLREAYQRLISLPGRVEMALKLGNTLRVLVPLERQAAGLADGYVDAATERAKKESAQTATVVETSFDAVRGKIHQIMLQVSQKAS